MDEWERQRLERLERRQRQWFVVVIAAAALLLLAAAAEPQATEMRVRRLVIVDEQGRDRIVLRTSGAEKAHMAEVVLLGESGTERIVLATTGKREIDAASIHIADPRDNIRWILHTDGLAGNEGGGASMAWQSSSARVVGVTRQFGDHMTEYGHGKKMGERRLIE